MAYRQCRPQVAFDYIADGPDELSIKKGQLLKIIDRPADENGWWRAQLDGTTVIGFIPSNYVEPYEAPN
jgi:hypothetical protein